MSALHGHRSNVTGVPLPCVECGEPSYAVHAKVCRECQKRRQQKSSKDYRSSNPRKYTDADKASMKAWRQNNYEKYLVGAARGRAKKLGIPFNLSHGDISIPEVCPVLGITLTTEESRERKDNLATLDRIVPALGYVKGNVAVISWRANFLKNNGLLSEFEAIVSWLRGAA